MGALSELIYGKCKWKHGPLGKPAISDCEETKTEWRLLCIWVGGEKRAVMIL